MIKKMRRNSVFWGIWLQQFVGFWRQQWLVFCRYSKYRRFLGAWLWLHLGYLFSSPYRVSRKYQRKIKSEDLYVYGETPLTTLAIIAERAKLTEVDHVYELGAGSGFTSLWLNAVKQCRVTAIEQIPVFCWRLMRTAKRFRLQGLQVRCDDYLTTELKQANVIYLYGSNLDNETIFKLTMRLSAMPSGTRIITVSYPLDEDNLFGVFELTDQFEADFEWGKAVVYLQNIR